MMMKPAESHRIKTGVALTRSSVLINSLRIEDKPHVRNVFLLTFAVIAPLAVVIARRPDAIFNPQFWAEDGKVFYADAYNFGFRSVAWPVAGYLQTLPRLAALLSLGFPFRAAPFVLNCIAIVVQVLPAVLLLSKRLDPVGTWRPRCLLAFLYLTLPNSHELHGNITNAQWALALSALLVIFARPAKSLPARVFDIVVVGLCSLTGPFVILIAPIGVAKRYMDRPETAAAFTLALAPTAANAAEPRRSIVRQRPQHEVGAYLLGITALGAVGQAVALISTGASARIHVERGASLLVLLKILAKQIFLAVFLGRRVLSSLTLGSWRGIVIAAIAVFGGICIVAYALCTGPLRLKLFLAFSLCILVVSLAYPMTQPPQWPVLSNAGGVRYWFFPMLAVIASLVWLLDPSNMAWVRCVATVLILLMGFGILQDFGEPRLQDKHFESYVSLLSTAASGSSLTIPLNPNGWLMHLTKK